MQIEMFGGATATTTAYVCGLKSTNIYNYSEYMGGVTCSPAMMLC